MNTFTHISFNIRNLVVITTISLLLALIAGHTVQANESTMAPSENDTIAYALKMTNTPGYGELSNHWDEYVASLNWLDYQQPLAINEAPLSVTSECGGAC